MTTEESDRRRERAGAPTGKGSQVHGPLMAIWLAGTAGTLLAGGLGVIIALATFLAATCAMFFVLRLPLASRLLAAAAMAPALLGDPAPAWAWLAAGAALILANAPGIAHTASRAELSEVQRALERCRRKEERAHLLVLRGPADTVDAASLAASFRVTDAVDVLLAGREVELDVLVEDGDGTREGLERRLIDGFGRLPPFGWATFPDDGVTLEVLQDQARRGWLRHSPGQATAASPVAPSDKGERAVSL